jgi:hypothetical protein
MKPKPHKVVAMRFDLELLEELDAYCLEGPVQLQRTSVIEAAVREFLRNHAAKHGKGKK